MAWDQNDWVDKYVAKGIDLLRQICFKTFNYIKITFSICPSSGYWSSMVFNCCRRVGWITLKSSSSSTTTKQAKNVRESVAAFQVISESKHKTTYLVEAILLTLFTHHAHITWTYRYPWSAKKKQLVTSQRCQEKKDKKRKGGRNGRTFKRKEETMEYRKERGEGGWKEER